MVFDEKKFDWFPGHMKLTKNLIKVYLNSVDLVIYLVDARVPFSSLNLSVLRLVSRKPVVVFFAKSDLANEGSTKLWVEYFKKEFNLFSFALSCKNVSQVKAGFKSAGSHLEKIKKLKFGVKLIRVMVIGIPNVGKSTLINSVCGAKKSKVENRPGVTRSMRWFFLKNGFSLLDTPGVLPVEVDNENKKYALQLIGAVKREMVDMENLALQLLNHFKHLKTNIFKKKFSSELVDCESEFDWLIRFAKLKGMVLKNSEPDLERASRFIVDEFQKGKLGKITLELPGFCS